MANYSKSRSADLYQQSKDIKSYAIKLNILPSSSQQDIINQTFGCARFAYNSYLAARKDYYDKNNSTLSNFQYDKIFNQLKKQPEFSWLKKVDKFAMQNAFKQVNFAYDRFFKKLGAFPKFKSKKSSKLSYTTNFTNNNIELTDSYIKLPKLGKVNYFANKNFCNKINHFINSDSRILSATISKKPNGNYYVSINIEEIVNIIEPIKIYNENQIVGVDLGIKDFCILSDGTKINNPKKYKTLLKRLTKYQRKLSKMTKNSNNYNKQKVKIAKLHSYIYNFRNDFLHKESRKLVNSYDCIIFEDLNIKGMVKNKRLAQSILDTSWGKFKTYVNYKAKWEGKTVLSIDRFYPSSKTCNCCGEKNPMLTLNDREWMCPNCKTILDRDVNAAKNIKDYGINFMLNIA